MLGIVDVADVGLADGQIAADRGEIADHLPIRHRLSVRHHLNTNLAVF